MLVIRLCGGVEVEADGRLLPASLLAGRQGRLVLAYLACERHRAVPREELAELLWPGELPASWTSSLHAVISRLRKLFVEAGLDGTSTLTSAGGAYRLVLPDDAEVDWEVAVAGVAAAEQAVAADDGQTAVDAGTRAGAIAGRGFLRDDAEWVDEQRDAAHDLGVRAALAVADGHLLLGAAARAVEAAREALGRDPLREAAFRVLMRALAAAGERAEALRVWERCRTTLVEELGVDPSPETEAVYLGVLDTGERPTAAPPVPSGPTQLPSGVVTFLLTDIVGSSVLWEEHPAAMAAALERHDQLVAEVVTAHGGTLLKSKLEGDATVSVFARATAGALAALALRDALRDEPWPEGAAPSLRMAMHTGEAFERDGDYFGPALNRAARLRGLADAGQVLLSQAVAELVRDHLPEDVALADRGHRDLRGLSRGENVYELAPVGELGSAAVAPSALERPPLPPPLASPGPFVGRGDELTRLAAAWERAALGEPHALLLAGEPGVGKSRLAAECARAAHDAGALVLYGRCDEELGAPLQPFIEALRSLAPALGSARLRAVRGIDELSRLVPELGQLLPDAAPAARADPDSERYALFDATTEVLCTASAEAPTLLVLDDLHWAGKTTLSLLRHLLRNAKDARLLVLGTYRDTELARTHPLAALLADLRRDRAADKLTLAGLEPDDVAEYLRAVGNTDRALGRELAEVTSGNPFFLIEALRHVEETGGRWEPGSLPEGVREATGRRLSQLSDTANDALSVAAVAGTTFDLALVERVADVDVLDGLGEAVQAGLILEEAGAPGRFRFAHALVRQVLLAELVTIKRLRLHRTIAELLEAEVGADPDEHLTDLAHHWFECALTGGGEKAVDACRRAADRARERLAYEEAGDLYGMAIQALDAVESVAEDDVAALHLARCDALLTAGDVAAARGAIDALGQAARDSARLRAWHTTYAGQLAVLAEPDRLDEIVASIGDAAAAMHEVGDLTGEATARYVHALALERLGRIGAAQRALDEALAAARTADDRRLADAILAEVPPAALWGPSPVTRASGNCLDVVRVLRITDGAPAVESVALRCQAVLEALRGRMDAARRMVASAHRMVDQLGLVHRRLETDVSAGFIELLDRQAEAAEAHLRPAYEDLRDRGLGGEAAQAAALLGRALLMQGRDDEAEAVAQEAEQLAGADLKAAIAWRDVRAEAAARRGDTALALDLAREAVELATATDALLLVADARLALATVLRASGDVAAAQAEAARAIEVCDAKGATALADGARARAGAPGPTSVALQPTVAPASGDVLALLDNAAVRRMRGYEQVWLAGDWDAVAAYVGEGWDSSDRRTVIGAEWDATESMESLREIFEGGAQQTLHPVALRGDRLALFDLTWSHPEEDWEVRLFELFEVDERGLAAHSSFFDEDKLADAIEELDRRYLEAEGADGAAVFATCTELVSAINAGDWARARATLRDDLRIRNQRTMRGDATEVSADEWAAAWADAASVWGRFEVRIAHVPRLSAGAGVAVLRMAGEGEDTHGPSERWLIEVVQHDGTLLTGIDVFQEDQLADALVRFDELTHPAEDVLTTAAVRAARRFVAAVNAQDLDQVLACVTDDFQLDDRRALVGAVTEHDTHVRNLADVLQGVGSISSDLLATRGDHLLLHRVSWTAQQGQIDLLAVAQTDDDERHEHSVWFGPDDLDAAYAELDRLYLEGEGAPHAAIVETILGWLAAMNDRRWDDARQALADDFVVRDHRTTSFAFSPLSGEQWVASWPEVAKVWGRSSLRLVHVPRLSATAGLWILKMAGEDSATHGPSERWWIQVFSHDGTRVTGLDVYEDDRVAEALARFDELSNPPEDFFANAAVREVSRMEAALNRHSFEEALAVLAPEPRVDDRRALVGTGVSEDEGLVSHMTFILGGGGTVRSEVVATRGDDLCLTRVWWSNDESEIELLHVGQLDEEGRYAVAIWFDPDDLDAAHAELDRLHQESGAPDAAGFLTRINARDFVGAMDLLAPNCVIDDHRPTRFGRIEGREQIIDFYRSTVDLAPTVRSRVHHARATDRVAIGQVTMFGEVEGSPYEVGAVSVIQRDAQERITHFDFYDEADLSTAVARYRALVAQQDTADAGDEDGCHPRFVNAVVRCARRARHAHDTGDFEAAMACFAPGALFRDDRSLAHYADEATSDAQRAALRYVMAGGGTMRSEVVATRGEHLGVSRVTWSNDDAEVQLLILARADDDERMDLAVWYDPEDLDSAYEELDRLYAELGADPLFLLSNRMIEAINARDWEAAQALLTPDFVLTDHRPIRFGVVEGSGAFVDLQRSGIDLSPDSRLLIHHHLEDGPIGIRLMSLNGTIEGAPFQNRLVAVHQMAPDGRMARRDFYSPDQLDEAFALYDQLVAARARVPEDGCPARFVNHAVRGSRALQRAANAGDEDAALRHFTDDSTFEDRRSLLRFNIDDSEATRENARFIVRGGGVLHDEVLATRGERLCLARVTWSNDRAEVTNLGIAQVDEHGRHEHLIWFDEDDLDAAYAELHRMHLELGADPLYLAEHRTKEAIEARDWDALEATLAQGCVSVDHRPARFGVIHGSRAYVDLLRSGVELAPDMGYVLHHHLAEGGVALAVISRAGTVDGGPFRNVLIDITRHDANGLVTHRDFYADDQLDEALALYDELVAAQAALADDGCPERFVTTAVRAARALLRAMNAQDLDATMRCFAPGATFHDRRPLLQSSFDITGPVGRESFAFIYAAHGTLRSRVVATRGDRFVLSSVRWVSEHGAEADILWIGEANDRGLLEDVTWLDPDDHDAAYAELDARWVASADGDDEAFARRVSESLAAYAEGDLEPVLSFYGPDVAVHDHQAVGFGTLDRSGWVAHVQRLKDDAPDARFRVHHVLRSSGAVLRVNTITGTAPSGEFELASVHVDTMGPDDTYARIDVYGPDQLDEALARYDELDARHGDLGPFDRALDAFNAHDWDTVTALSDEDPTIWDHRQMGWGRVDLPGLIAHYRATAELAPDFQARVDRVVDRTDHVLLLAMTNAGTRDGGPFEFPFLAVYAWGPDRRTTVLEYWDPEDLDRARARFAELAAVPDPGQPAVSNLATENSKRFLAALRAGDPSAIEATLHPTEFGWTDRRHYAQLEGINERRWLFHEEVDPAWGEAARAPWVGDTELLATRGDRLALFRSRNGAGANFPLDFLAVVEVDEDGLRTAVVQFDVDDLDDAYQELDTRFGGTGFIFRGIDAYNARDWDGLTELFEPTAEIHDHRRVGWGQVDVAGIVERYRWTAELSPDARARAYHFLETTDRAALASLNVEGTHEGGDFERPFLAACAWAADGRCTAWHIYEPEDLDRARARFTELTSATAAQPFTNMAVRNVERFVELWPSKDADAIGALFAEGNVYDERRRSAMMEGITAEDSLRLLLALDDSEWGRPTVLATRGDRLGLWRSTFRFTDGAAGTAEADLLVVGEVDEAGRRTATVSFDPDDLRAAYDELDARFVAQGGPDLAWFRRRFAAADWDGMTALFDPTFEAVDHRPGGWGRLDRAGYIDGVRALHELAPDAYQVVHQLLAQSDRAGMDVGAILGTREGGKFEIPTLRVARFGPDGRSLRWDFYGSDQLDEARARFEEVAAAPAEDPFTNTAMRTSLELAVGLRTKDWERIQSLVAPGFVAGDRRPSALMDGIPADRFFLPFLHLDEAEIAAQNLLATRGERLALIASTMRVRDKSVGEARGDFLNLVEVDEAGLCTTMIAFEPDDFVSAYDELDARYVAMGGEDFRWFRRHPDGDALAARLAPGAQAVDHRLHGWGRLDRAGYETNLRTLGDLSADSVLVVHHVLATTDGLSLTRGGVVGSRDGGDFEIPLVRVIRLDAQGRLLSWDMYSLDQLDEAWARYHELSAAPADDQFTNAAVRAGSGMADALRAKDWGHTQTLLADGFAAGDRRRVARVEGITADQFFLPFLALDEAEISHHRVLATRGDRLALLDASIRVVDQSAGEASLDYLNLLEVDEAGLCTALVSFDPDDLDAAYDELDARYVAMGGHDVGAVGRAQRARDWDGLAAQFTPDFELIDHRLLGMIGRDVSDFLRNSRAGVDLSPDNRVEVHHVLAANALAVHSLCRGVGTVDGGEYEYPLDFVGGITADERWWRWEFYAPEQHEQAWARYEELADPTVVHPNRAHRTLEAVWDAYDRRDWDDVDAICADDMVFDDRRNHVTGGKAMFVDHGRALAEQGAQFRRELLAAPGAELCEYRRLARDEAGTWEVENYLIVEVDDDGFLTAFLIFDGDDRVGAANELARRHLAHLGAPPTAAEGVSAFNRPDLSAARAAFDGCRFEDHRRGRVGLVNDAGDFLALVEAVVSLTMDRVIEIARVFAGRSDGSVGLIRTSGTMTDGAAFESVSLVLLTWDEVGPTVISFYEVEDLDAALARFEELRPT